MRGLSLVSCLSDISIVRAVLVRFFEEMSFFFEVVVLRREVERGRAEVQGNRWILRSLLILTDFLFLSFSPTFLLPWRFEARFYCPRRLLTLGRVVILTGPITCRSIRLIALFIFLVIINHLSMYMYISTVACQIRSSV